MPQLLTDFTKAFNDVAEQRRSRYARPDFIGESVPHAPVSLPAVPVQPLNGNFVQGSAATLTNLTFTLPSAPNVGDVMVCMATIIGHTGGNPAAQTGWTALDMGATSGPGTYSVFRVATAADTATQTPLSNPSNQTMIGGIWVIAQDAVNAAPVDAHHFGSPATNSFSITMSVSPTTSDGIVLAMIVDTNAGNTWGAAPGWFADIAPSSNTLFCHAENLPAGPNGWAFTNAAKGNISSLYVSLTAQVPAFPMFDLEVSRRMHSRYNAEAFFATPVVAGDPMHVIVGTYAAGYGVEWDFFGNAYIVAYSAGVATPIGAILQITPDLAEHGFQLSVTPGTPTAADPNIIQASIDGNVLAQVSDYSINLTGTAVPITMSAGNPAGTADQYLTSVTAPTLAAAPPSVQQGAVTGYQKNLIPDSGWNAANYGAPGIVQSSSFTLPWAADVAASFSLPPVTGWMVSSSFANPSISSGGGASACFINIAASGTGPFSRRLTSKSFFVSNLNVHTLSVFIDATQVSTGSLTCELWNSGGNDVPSTMIGHCSMPAGSSGRVKAVINTVGIGGAVQVVFSTNAVTMPFAAIAFWSEPQLQIGSTMTAYQENFSNLQLLGAMPTQVQNAIAQTADAYNSNIGLGQVNRGAVEVGGQPGGTNIAVNPTFASGTADWTGPTQNSGTGTWTWSTDKFGGGRLLAVQNVTAAGSQFFQQTYTGLTTGQAMVASAMVTFNDISGSGGAFARLQVVGVPSTTVYVQKALTATSGGAQLLSGAFTLSGGDTSVALSLIVNNGSSGGSVNANFQKVQLEYGTQPSIYADHQAAAMANIALNGDGSLSNGISVNSGATHFFAGSGAPAGALGAVGDFYFRDDGGAGTTLYLKTGAATWTGRA